MKTRIYIIHKTLPVDTGLPASKSQSEECK